MKKLSIIILAFAALFTVSCKKKIPTKTISLLDGKVTFEIPDDENIELKGRDVEKIDVRTVARENDFFRVCEPETFSPPLMNLVFADGRTIVPEHVLEMLENYKLEENEEFALIPSQRWSFMPRENYLRSSYTRIYHNEKIIGECLFRINNFLLPDDVVAKIIEDGASYEDFALDYMQISDNRMGVGYTMCFIVEDNIIEIKFLLSKIMAEDVISACPEFFEQKDGYYRFKSPQAMDEFYALLESGETKRMPEILQLLHTTKEMALSTLTIKD